jgi:hypothetical protein
MAWLTLADATGVIEAAVFPSMDRWLLPASACFRTLNPSL